MEKEKEKEVGKEHPIRIGISIGDINGIGPEVMAEAINSHPELQRYKILFISGNHSRILSCLSRNINERDVRRANTLFQFMTILEENHHSFLIVEHDPLLYEDSQEMVGYLAQALKQISREATVLLL